MSQSGIFLSLTEFRSLIDTDEDLHLQRSWLLRNTNASVDSTVIQPHHAAAIKEIDPDGSVIHVQTYTTEHGEAVYTAWHPMTWKESDERRRLHKIANSTWREEHEKRGRCLDLIDEFIRKLNVTFGFAPNEYAPRFMAMAESTGFTESKMHEYLNFVDKQFKLTEYYEAIQKIEKAGK